MNTKGQAYAYTLAKLFEVKDTGGKGKGLFAKEPLLKGTVVTFECQQCRRILKDDFESIPMVPIYFRAMKSFT
jgi:hypothetical protein